MLVEVKGIDWRNLGAELMLVAIIEAFETRGMQAQFAVEPPSRGWFREKYGLALKLRYVRRGINLLQPLQWLPKPLRRKFGWVVPADIDVVLDASGFGYGDTWGHRAIQHRLGGTVEQLCSVGVPVILLPQALGPFTKKLQRAAFLPILQHAHLIFARDAQSMTHLQPLLDALPPGAGHAKVRQAPDFTNLVQASDHGGAGEFKQAVCIIVNNKMRTKLGDGEKYLAFLLELMEWLTRAGHRFYFLLHERQEDKALIQELEQRWASALTSVEPDDAKQAKAYIKDALMVITSRFHGLVSALTQAVPVVATSWGHKYDALLSDYGIAHHKIVLDGPRAIWQDLLSELSSKDGQAAARKHLAVQLQSARAATEAMWAQVFDELKNNKQVDGKNNDSA